MQKILVVCKTALAHHLYRSYFCSAIMQNTKNKRFMKTKYFKRFAITDKLVSIEELRNIAQMQARMDDLVRYSPIQHLSDGYSFSMDEVCDTEISFSDILWAKGVNAEHSFLHMKNGKTIALPFGTHGLETLLRDSIEPHFLKISRNVFIPVSMIEKVSRKVVYLKGCDIPFKVSVTYSPVLIYSLYEYLTVGIEKWCVQDYICWKVKQQQK